MNRNECKKHGYEFRTFKKTWRVSYLGGGFGIQNTNRIVATGRRAAHDDSHIAAMCEAATVDMVLRRVTQ